MTEFLRRNWNRHSKLGKRRKKKQTWRKPRGRDNKMREQRKGYPAIVKVGYKQNEKQRKTIENKIPVIIKNIKELEAVGKNKTIIVGKIGKKKRIEIAKKAKEKGIKIFNMNVEKFLKEIERAKKEVKKIIENKHEQKKEKKDSKSQENIKQSEDKNESEKEKTTG